MSQADSHDATALVAPPTVAEALAALAAPGPRRRIGQPLAVAPSAAEPPAEPSVHAPQAVDAPRPTGSVTVTDRKDAAPAPAASTTAAAVAAPEPAPKAPAAAAAAAPAPAVPTSDVELGPFVTRLMAEARRAADDYRQEMEREAAAVLATARAEADRIRAAARDDADAIVGAARLQARALAMRAQAMASELHHGATAIEPASPVRDAAAPAAALASPRTQETTAS